MDPTTAWAQRVFRQYYRTNQVYLPPRFTRREYGFMFHGGRGMQRHVGFRNGGELVKHLVERGPAHAYYSTAYYERPGATLMEDKGWLGADLIFDLDADHLPDAKGQPFAALLERVRDETVHVVEEFLLGHFGFEERDLRIVFSGGRGYHVHVDHPDVHPLEAEARREIVSYVTGNGIDVDRLVRKRAVAKKVVAGRAQFDERIEVPRPDEPGWRGLAGRALEAELRRLAALEDTPALAELESFDGVGPKRAAEALAALRAGASAKEVVARLPVAFSRHAIERAAVAYAGEADEPVTADVKRLIRLPGTLHGKSGLRVTPIPLSDLPGFDPLVDAVALPEDEVAVEVTKPAAVALKGEEWKVEPGTRRLPLHAAAWFVLRGAARIPGVAA